MMNEWELDKSRHYTVTDEEIAELLRDANQVRNYPLADLAGRALGGNAEARDRVARMIKQKYIEELEEIRAFSRLLQQFIAQLEYENERVDEIAEDALGNGWEKGTLASLKYRAQQLKINAIDIVSHTNDIVKRIERLK